MYRLEFDKEADLEFSDAFIWHERKREGLGIEFETAIFEALTKIAANPKHYGNSGNGFRQNRRPEISVCDCISGE